MTTTTTTWADGFGVWHCTVTGGEQWQHRELATTEILAAIRDRTRYTISAKRIGVTHTSSGTTDDGRIVTEWIETDPAEHAEALGLDYDELWEGFATACLWTGVTRDPDDPGTEDDPNLDNLDAHVDLDDLDDVTVCQMAEALGNFLQSIAETEDYLDQMMVPYLARRTSSDFGHDFALTREGHGTGFWDRGLGAAGDLLTMIAKSHSGEGLTGDLDDDPHDDDGNRITPAGAGNVIVSWLS